MKSTATTPKDAIPAGYRRDAKQRLVPESQIKEIDKVRDELVHELWDRASQSHERLVAEKKRFFDDINAFVQLSADAYGVQLGGDKGNVTLLSFDGQYKVVRAMADRINFDERLQAAKALIDECLSDWTQGARPEVVVLIQDAFRVDASGKVRTGDVLALRRLAIEEPRWKEAMRAIGDAVQVVGTSSYVRFYQRDDNGNYQAMSLDMSAV